MRAPFATNARRPNVRAARRDLAALLQGWGGVTIAYRRRLIDSPSYTLNHEEIEKALEEGIRFAEGLTPLAIEVDADGAATGLKVSLQHNDGDGVWHETTRTVLPARTILIAAGTQPNTVLAREDAAHFHLDGKYFRLLDEAGQSAKVIRGLAKPAQPAVLTDILPDGRATSFFGDLHPSFSGNVVKAMASAKQGYPIVSRMLAKVAPASKASDADFYAVLDRSLRATVVRVERLTPTIVEVVVHAPAAAERFRPGQFYRLQNYETLAARRDGTRLVMEGLALTGAWVDRERGLVSTIVLEMGGSSDLCRQLQARRARRADGTHRDRLPRSSRTRRSCWRAAVWATRCCSRSATRFALPDPRCCTSPATRRWRTATRSTTSRRRPTSSSGAATRRPDSRDGARATARSSATSCRRCRRTRRANSAARRSAFSACDRIIAIGSDKMMAAVAAARHTVLAPYLKPDHRAIGSINSPMQCMMKEICAQCLQPHRDPVTGKVTYVFSCFNQDQPLDLRRFSRARPPVAAEFRAGEADGAVDPAGRRARLTMTKRQVHPSAGSPGRRVSVMFHDNVIRGCCPRYGLTK